MGNSAGGHYRTTKENFWKAFDKLPPCVRARLCDAVLDWVPQPLVTEMHRGAKESELLAIVERWDRIELAKREKECNSTLSLADDFRD